MTSYETPAAPAGDPLVCRGFALRPGLWRVVFDHLAKLTRDYQWSLGDGGMSVEQATDEIRAGIDVFVFGGCVMIGQVMWLATATIPDWCLLCDGAFYEKVDYPELYAALANSYKGISAFNVPSLIDKTARGSASPGTNGGAATHTLTVNEMPAHTHTEVSPVGQFLAFEPGEAPVILTSAIVPTGSAGLGLAHNNWPPYHTLIPVIIARLPNA